jgi:hypothetical protein
MNRTLRSLVIIAGVAVLAASSQATITFSPLTSDISVSTNPTNQVSAIPPRLSAGVFGNVSVTDTGSTLVTSTSGITTLSVDEAGGYAFSGASVSLTVTLYKGNNTSYPSVTLFTDSTTSSFLSNSVTTVNLGAGDVDLITFSATYTGTGAPFSGGVVGAFTIAAQPAATPEPAAYATFGVGLVGLIIRRRRSTK